MVLRKIASVNLAPLPPPEPLFYQHGIKYSVLRVGDCPGLRFVIRNHNLEDSHFASLRFEIDVLKMFKPKHGQTIIDVGAYIGGYTCRAAKAVGENGTVIAVEPEPENLKMLTMNVKINDFKNVVIVASPLFSEEVDLNLFVPYYSSNAFVMRNRLRGEAPLKVYKVKAVTLDNLIQRLGIQKIDWLKIDVEGAEVEVLSGASESLKITGSMIIEVSPENLDKTLEILKKYDFNVYDLGIFYTNLHYLLCKK